MYKFFSILLSYYQHSSERGLTTVLTLSFSGRLIGRTPDFGSGNRGSNPFPRVVCCDWRTSLSFYF